MPVTLSTHTVTATVTSTSTPLATATTSVTVTNTVTVTSTVTPAPTTTVVTASYVVATPVATGMNYYVYTSEIDYNQNESIDPSTYQNEPGYEASGVISDVNSVGSNDYNYYYQGFCNLPNGEVDCNGVAIVFQGFFFAAEAGTYTFSTPNSIDNELILFTGPVAYGTNGAWDSSSWDYDALRAGTGPYTGGSYSVTLAAGEVYPVTLIWGNSSDEGQLYFYITTPDGTTHTSSDGFSASQCAAGPFVP